MSEPVEVIPADDPRAVRVAALLRPASFASVPRPDPFAAFDLDLGALDLHFPDLSALWP